MKALKRDIENMQLKAVEVAKSNSKSESIFQLLVSYGLYFIAMLLATPCLLIGQKLRTHWTPADI